MNMNESQLFHENFGEPFLNDKFSKIWQTLKIVFAFFHEDTRKLNIRWLTVRDMCKDLKFMTDR
ncbi:hypothetical protein CN563_06495 [Bacillus sp. AFS026049]|nr:hypothetical protein CN563_06495 [Bacillus sp. AFS026049]